MTTPVYPSGSPTAITVDLPLWAGSPLTPTAVSAVVTDEAGVVITSYPAIAPLPNPGDTSMVIPVDATANTLAAGTPSGLRQVTVSFTTAQGPFTAKVIYLLDAAEPLIRMENSFITWPETFLIRHQMIGLDGWDAASDSDRVAALITAHKNMTQLRYRFPIGENFQSRIVDFYGMSVDNVFGRIFVVLADIIYYNETDFFGWPEDFRNALMRAQMAEADNLLAGDPIGKKRAEGIASETIGESSMTFRKVPEIQFPICRAAMTQLRGYLNNSVLIGRA